MPWGLCHKQSHLQNCQETILESRVEVTGWMWKEHKSPHNISSSVPSLQQHPCLPSFLLPVTPQTHLCEPMKCWMRDTDDSFSYRWPSHLPSMVQKLDWLVLYNFTSLYYLTSLVQQPCEVSTLRTPILEVTIFRLKEVK